jgi:hypothetical protein
MAYELTEPPQQMEEAAAGSHIGWLLLVEEVFLLPLFSLGLECCPMCSKRTPQSRKRAKSNLSTKLKFT